MYKSPPLHTAKIGAIAKKLRQQEGKDFVGSASDVAFRDSLRSRYDLQAQYLLQTGVVTADQTIEFYSDKALKNKVATITPSERSTELKYEQTREEVRAASDWTPILDLGEAISDSGAVEAVPILNAVGGGQSASSVVPLANTDTGALHTAEGSLGKYSDFHMYPEFSGTPTHLGEDGLHQLKMWVNAFRFSYAIGGNVYGSTGSQFLRRFSKEADDEVKELWTKLKDAYVTELQPYKGADYKARAQVIRNHMLPIVESFKRYMLEKYIL